jgi:hypothetical protein
VQVGSVLTRKSMALFLDSTSFMRPSCGTRFSAMFRREMTLMREAILSLMHQRAACDFAQDAVGAETDAVVLLVGLEVDVGGAVVDRVEQHFLDELDDRGVVDVLRAASGAFSATVLVE